MWQCHSRDERLPSLRVPATHIASALLGSLFHLSWWPRSLFAGYSTAWGVAASPGQCPCPWLCPSLGQLPLGPAFHHPASTYSLLPVTLPANQPPVPPHLTPRAWDSFPSIMPAPEELESSVLHSFSRKNLEKKSPRAWLEDTAWGMSLRAVSENVPRQGVLSRVPVVKST